MFRFSQLFEPEDGHARPVPHIPQTNATGEAFTHTIEPELAGASIPRVARLTADTLFHRRCGWNASLVLAGFIAFCVQRISGDPFWAAYGFGAFTVLAAIILLIMHRQDTHLRLLREGVAVHGLLRSGEVIEHHKDLTEYRLHYTYWTGDKTRHGSLSVTETEYIQRVTGNPYFTVLYDATNPRRSVPYFRISAAELVAK